MNIKYIYNTQLVQKDKIIYMNIMFENVFRHLNRFCLFDRIDEILLCILHGDNIGSMNVTVSRHLLNALRAHREIVRYLEIIVISNN